MDQNLSNLSHDYVFNHILKKLADTFERYRNEFPEIAELERSITSVDATGKNDFEVLIIVIEKLQQHSERSGILKQIFDNTRVDFYHGVDPENYPQHKGRFYIDSIDDQ